MSEKPKCETCEWWERRQNSKGSTRAPRQDGKCYGGPPTARPDKFGLWPKTKATHWCGQHSSLTAKD